MKKFLLFIGILTMVFGSVSAKGESEKPATDDGALVFGYAVQDLGNQYWVTAAEGVKSKCDELGISVNVMDANCDPSKELANIEDMILSGVDAILLSPWDADSGSNGVIAANKAGIPVFVLDIGVNDGDIETFIVSDNVEGGRMAGEFIAEDLKAGDEVAHIQCQLGYVIPALRGQGFEEVMKEKNMNIVATQPADSQRSKGMDVMQNILQANPNLKAVFCENDEMALGAIEAVAAAGLTGKVKVVGFDGTDDAVAAINEGRLSGTIAQQPFKMGELGVQAAVDFLDGKTLEETTYVPVKLLKK